MLAISRGYGILRDRRSLLVNLNQLRVFHGIALSGSLSAAARALRVSQPAVSKQLAELEEECGFRLCDRLPRGVRLTPEGRSLAQSVARVFAAEGEVEAVVETLRAGLTTRISVGASSTIGSYLVPRLLGALRRSFPRAHVSLEVGNSDAVLDLVRGDRVDLGLTEGPEPTEGLVSTVFAEDELYAIAAPSDPILSLTHVTLERFLSRPQIFREPGSGTRAVLDEELKQRGLTLTPSLELGSTEAVKNAVLHRLGVAFVSSLALEMELESGRLVRVPIVDFARRRALHVVHLPGRAMSPLAQAFLALVKDPGAQGRGL